jgi:hypothetical protein
MAIVGTAGVLAISMLRSRARAAPDSVVWRWAVILVIVLVSVLPSLSWMRPGPSIASGELASVGSEIVLPSSVSGELRVLASGSLPGESVAFASYVIGIDGQRIEGSFERSVRRSWRKIGRFYNERASEYHLVDISPGAQRFTLERLEGRLAGGVHVQVFPVHLPIWILWIMILVALALAAAVDVLGRHHGTFAVYAGISLAVGTVARVYATPASALATAIASIVLGVPGGSIVGLSAVALARRLRDVR